MYRKLLILLLLGLPFQLLAQFTISGIVTDTSGLPLAGANILVKDTYIGTSSDHKGNFELHYVPKGKIVIVVMYLGFSTTEKEIIVKKDISGLKFELHASFYTTGEFTVTATRAKEVTPIAFQNIDSAELVRNNLGVDIPYVLESAVSVVSTSDAGGGVGYTSMRIRGSDASRVAVSINGIPYNDPESQGTFWVNMPDLASSTNSIQIQRGVGTSTNGAGAFGATVNINTTAIPEKAFGSYSGSFGSFNTQKHTFQLGSGLLKNHFAFNGRFSKIKSDGYIDRAASDLASYYLSGAYYGKTGSLQFITFSGHENTYQAWYGVPESYIESNRTYNPYDYPDQVDDYRQTHYQLHLKQDFGAYFKLNISGYYIKGSGYFEQYEGTEYNKDIGGRRPLMTDFGLDPIVIDSNIIIQRSSLVVRRWLDNDFTGTVFALEFDKDKWNVTLGGGYSYYDGDHFGEVIWAEFAGKSQINHPYYSNYGKKSDFNVYLKAFWQVHKDVNLYVDMQYRKIDYRIYGTDNDQSLLDIQDKLDFINPKIGVNWRIAQSHSLYGSVSVGNHEPNRSDYIDAKDGTTAQPESMLDYELGYKLTKRILMFNANVYFMDYTDQLVLTGAVNDVGTPVRVNVENSYRAGVELVLGVRITKGLKWMVNTTLSQNKIQNLEQKVDDWYNGGQSVYNLTNTDIAYSPNFIAGSVITYTTPLFMKRENNPDALTLSLISKYVGKQYLDNTQSEFRKLDPYFTNNFQLTYTLQEIGLKTLSFNFLVRNIFNSLYVSNGWVYTFEYNNNLWDPTTGSIYTESIGNGQYQMKGLYPQAGINVLFGITLGF